jgi:hypothetical protein
MIGEQDFLLGFSVLPRIEATLQKHPFGGEWNGIALRPSAWLRNKGRKRLYLITSIFEQLNEWGGGALVARLFRKAGASFYEGVSTSHSMHFRACQLLIAVQLSFSELSVYFRTFGLNKRYGTGC